MTRQVVSQTRFSEAVTPRAPGPGGSLESAGQLRELLARAKKVLGSIVAVAVSPNYGDPSTKLVNIALIASDALKALEEAV